MAQTNLLRNDYNNKKRNPAIDVLRTLGTLMIILAHVNPPKVIYEIRSFDVILLVFLSGLTINYVREDSLLGGIRKRIKRLVLPTYFLLCIYYTLSFVMSHYLKTTFDYDLKSILSSFIFFDSFAYIWIVRVYLLISFLSGSIVYFSEKIKNDWMFLALVVIASSIYNIVFDMNFYFKPKIIRLYIIEVLPYIFIATLGYRSLDNKKFVLKLSKISAVIFAILLIIGYKNGYSLEPNNFKFPPRIYYLWYGTLVTSFLYLCTTFRLSLQNKWVHLESSIIYPLIQWISKKSFTLYLSHIFVIYLYRVIKKILIFPLLNDWFISYVFVLIFSIMLTRIIEIIQNKLKEK